MIVTTERLLLTPVTPTEAADLVLLHADPNVAHWYDGVWSPEQARQWAAAMSQRWRQEGVGKWMARLRVDGTLVGRGGLTRTVLDGAQTLELNWALRDAARGHGYATEMGGAALTVAFASLQADRVVAFTEVHNHASQAVMRRLGMRAVGVIHRPGLVQGAEGVHEHAPFALYECNSARQATLRQAPASALRRGPRLAADLRE